jgi:selenocysteine lyase/cysteine desulfurase
VTTDFSRDFGPFGERTWLNCAHQGPLPRCAVEAAHEAIAWKTRPSELTVERFSGVPQRLRETLGRLLGAPSDEVVLGNSASYGLHLVANGFPWKHGDEALLVKGDFPSDIFPWLALERRGVAVRYVEPANHLPTAEEVAARITPRTRVFCSTWVHSFSGMTLDLQAVGEVCRARRVTFVVNGSQGVGARPIAVPDTAIDALAGVGFKWLCGPYGTGYCWIGRELRESLEAGKAYWLSQMTSEDLGSIGRELRLPPGPPAARTLDIFGTANFFNYTPWTASIDYILSIGVDRIAEHDQQLVSRFIAGLDESRYQLLSAREGPLRSTLVFVTHRDPERNQAVHARLKDAGIDVAFRRGNVRVAPHLYNTPADIDRALSVLEGI